MFFSRYSHLCLLATTQRTILDEFCSKLIIEAEIKMCVHEVVFVVNLELILGWKA